MSQESPALNFRTTCLRLFIASILATAFVGAVAIVIEPEGWWFETQLKILATSAILAGASVCGLICGGCYSLGHRSLPSVGMLFVLAAVLTGLFCVWAEPRYRDYEWLYKLNGCATTFGIGCSHLAMLLLLKVHRSYRWVHAAAYFVILGLSAFIASLIVNEGMWMDEMFTFRLLGVWSILATSISLIIPVLAFLSRGKLDEDGDTAEELQRRIAKKREELAALEERLAALPPAIGSPWDVQEATQADPTSVAASAGESLVGGSRHG